MTLKDVYKTPGADIILYALMNERRDDPKININFKMPTFTEHKQFMAKKPYKKWVLIMDQGKCLGSMNLTMKNEVGIFIFKKFKSKGFGNRALKMFLRSIKVRPLYANINTLNRPSFNLFTKHRFVTHSFVTPSIVMRMD